MKLNDRVRLTIKGALHLAKTTAAYWSCANDAVHEFEGTIIEVGEGSYGVRHHKLPMVKFQLDFDMICRWFRHRSRGDVRSISANRDCVECFHRCHMCGEEPYLAGEPTAVEIDLDGSGFNWGMCGYCIRKMYSALQEGNAEHGRRI